MRYGVVHLADLAAFGHSPTCEKKATSSGSWHEHRKQPIDLKVPVRSCILWKNHLFDLICYFTHLYAIVGSLASSTSFSPTSRKLVCLLFLTEEFFGPHQSLELWEASLHIEPDPMGQGGQGGQGKKLDTHRTRRTRRTWILLMSQYKPRASCDLSCRNSNPMTCQTGHAQANKFRDGTANINLRGMCEVFNPAQNNKSCKAFSNQCISRLCTCQKQLLVSSVF